MDEERSLLQKHYCEYHSKNTDGGNTDGGNTDGVTEESLVDQSWVYLSSGKPKYRFTLLNSDSYINVLHKVATDLERKEENFQKIQSGFQSLEQYGLNLWKFPWRKEYHTVKLYTAFFKCNVEQQLQDTEAIFDILKTLGYTEKGQQEVSIKEADRERAIHTSFELFLVQVDLQIIKKIIDHFREGEVTLREIIDARSRQPDVQGAIHYLEVLKASKRRKLEEPQGDDPPSHWHANSTYTGRTDKFNKVHSDSTRFDAEASADETTGRKPKSSTFSKGRDDIGADTYGSSGSTVSRRKPSGGAPGEYQVSSVNTGGRHYGIKNEQFSDQDLYGVGPEGSQTNGATQHNVDARYRTFPQTGPSYTSKQLNCHTGHSVVSQSGSPNELNQRNLDERYSTFPQSGSSYEEKQHYQNPRPITVPQTGPSHYSDKTEGRQHHRTVLYTGSLFYPDGTKDRMDSVLTTPRSTTHNETVPPSHVTSQYPSERYAGYVRDDQKRHAVVTQSSSVLPSSKVLPDTNGYQSTSSLRTDTRANVSASAGDARYANLQDITDFSGQTLIPNESDKFISSKEGSRRYERRDIKNGPSGTPSSEPMEVDQRENSRASLNDAASLHNGTAEGTYGKTPVQSRVTDLNATLKHNLTIESNSRVAGEESKQISSTSSEHRRQFDSERVAGGHTMASRAGPAGGAQPTRLLYPTTCKSGSSAADLKDHSTAKTEPKSSSPGPSRRASAQQQQTPGTSSQNDPRNEISRERHLLEKDIKGASICAQCGLQGTIICVNCLQVTICRACEKVYATDVCEVTKEQHVFVKLTDDKILPRKSGDPKAYESANTNEACGVGETDWSCSRCTYLNRQEHRICLVCAATRGIGDVESTKPGSKVCRNCTLHNEETATVCKACYESLSKSDTVV